jgi:hypothetical protein
MSYRPRRRVWSADTSWNISKCETHFGDCLPVSCWRITLQLYNDIREFPNCQRAYQKQDVRFGRDFASKFKQKPYFNAGIFIAYIRTILLLYIDTFRGRAVLAQEIAVLLMAHCSADVSDDVIRILTEARARVITFAPHTTQVLQVLDLAFFGVLNRCPRYELPFDENNATVKVITKVYHDFTQTMARPNVWGTFCALVFEFDTRREPYELLFDEAKLRESAGFQELCSVMFAWTSSRADDVLLASVGSTNLGKSTLRQ